jgi:hypothetical protein
MSIAPPNTPEQYFKQDDDIPVLNLERMSFKNVEVTHNNDSAHQMIEKRTVKPYSKQYSQKKQYNTCWFVEYSIPQNTYS